LGKPDKEQEKWLTSSVNAVSVAALEAPAGSDKAEKIPSARRLHIMGSDMRLPDWAKNHSIAAPFEALGSFYSKRQNPYSGLVLYLQAISILIPPPPLVTSPKDRCQGALLMREIALLHSRIDLIPEATSWAQKGLDIVIDTRQSIRGKRTEECRWAYIMSLLTLASLKELSGEDDKAREFYEAIVKECQYTDFDSIAEHVQQDLQKPNSKVRGNGEDRTV